MTGLTKDRFIDDMDGRFVCRLRSHWTSLVTSKARGAELTLQSNVAMLDAKFDLGVLDRLHEPCFVAIERPSTGAENWLIYEVVGVKATHLQEQGVDTSMPKVLREEFLRTIEKGWMDAKENWIDVTSFPTGYLARTRNEHVEFSRTALTPLTGTPVHMLSLEATNEFVCVEEGVEIGTLKGYGIPFTVRISDLIRYHTGIFGFTGVGKSNLVSSLVRKALIVMPQLRVVVFDVSGEYVVNLMDKVGKGSILTTEREILENPEGLKVSQIIPETLEDSLDGPGVVEGALADVHRKGGVRKLDLSTTRMADPRLGMITHLLSNIAESGETGVTGASVALSSIAELMDECGFDESVRLRDIASKAEAKGKLVDLLQTFRASVHERSSNAKEAEALVTFLSNPPPQRRRAKGESLAIGPEDLAHEVLAGPKSDVIIVYCADPKDGREATSRYIWELLEMKKKGYSSVNVLTVLDEAQEFIPDRTKREDFTEMSSAAVEALLRQGRKYRAGCWLSTQRVAHLNVNALQQLHSYFASTLPRLYDRMVIADAYSLEYEVLDRLADLEVGEWLFVSYKASKMRNVPVFIKAENNEDHLVRYLRGRKGQ